MQNRTAREIWVAALGELEIQVSSSNYQTWFKDTTGLSYQDNRFTISVPNTFVAEYLSQNQRSLIEKTLMELTSPDIEVVFQVNGRHQQGPSTAGSASQGVPASANLNARYVFQSFVEGKSNCLALRAALDVVQNPGKSYNPLYIYGGTGLGKTHLLHAIGHEARSRQTAMLCVSGEQFTNEFVIALRDRQTEQFRNRYRNAGILLIDDLHFIGGKEQTAESFFHTFNELHNSNRQIVITSDRPPGSMPVEDKLRSRLEWGLIVDVQPPDLDTRLAILDAKAQREQVAMPAEVLSFIAERTFKSVRDLEGGFNRVVAFSRLLRSSPTVETAAQALQDVASKVPGTSATPESVIKLVADSFKLGYDDLKGPRRDKQTAMARRVAMYLVRRETNCSLAQVGRDLGGRDASAVTNACKKVESDMATDSYLRRLIHDIQERINPGATPAA
ncbi:MAG: chromosomal replication initiator protein DnaA [Chloroflexi bacterium]|nr:chromosomal replication initiator protein DnaA [Chloroflexota bacterium]